MLDVTAIPVQIIQTPLACLVTNVSQVRTCGWK